MKYIVIILNVFLLFSCMNNGSDDHSHDGHESHGHNHGHSANEHMNQNSFEDLVDRFEGPERAEWQMPEKVFEVMGDIEGKKLYDIGPGTGYFSFMAVDRGAEVIAADIDQRFLDYIKHKRDSLGIEPSKLHVRKVNENSAGLRQGEADIAYMVNVYHHIDDRPEYFARIREQLNEGGKLMIIDFIKEETPHGPPASMRLAPDVVQEELEKAGFTKFDIITDVLPEQYIVVASVD